MRSTAALLKGVRQPSLLALAKSISTRSSKAILSTKPQPAESGSIDPRKRRGLPKITEFSAYAKYVSAGPRSQVQSQVGTPKDVSLADDQSHIHQQQALQRPRRSVAETTTRRQNSRLRRRKSTVVEKFASPAKRKLRSTAAATSVKKLPHRKERTLEPALPVSATKRSLSRDCSMFIRRPSDLGAKRKSQAANVSEYSGRPSAKNEEKLAGHRRFRSTLARCYTQGRLLDRHQRELKRIIESRQKRVEAAKNGTIECPLELPDDSNFAKMVNFIEEIKCTIESPYASRKPSTFQTTNRTKRRDEDNATPSKYFTGGKYDSNQRSHQKHRSSISTESGNTTEPIRPLARSHWLDTSQEPPQKSEARTSHKPRRDSPATANEPDSAAEPIQDQPAVAARKVSITLNHPDQDGTVEHMQVTLRPMQKKHVVCIRNVNANAAAACYGYVPSAARPMQYALSSNIKSGGGVVRKGMMEKLFSRVKRRRENNTTLTPVDGTNETTLQPEPTPASEADVLIDNLRKTFHVQQGEQVALVPRLSVAGQTVSCGTHDVMFTLPDDFVNVLS